MSVRSGLTIGGLWVGHLGKDSFRLENSPRDHKNTEGVFPRWLQAVDNGWEIIRVNDPGLLLIKALEGSGYYGWHIVILHRNDRTGR